MHIQSLKKYHFIDDFNHTKLKKLSRNINLIWRARSDQINIKLLKKTAIFCKKNRIKLFLANNVRLAIKLGLDGVYLSAHNKRIRSSSFCLKKNFLVIGSAHNARDIEIKKRQRVQELFISPIFKDKNRSAIGLHKSKYIYELFKGNKIALGGINAKNLKLLKLLNFTGFAGIKYFE